MKGIILAMVLFSAGMLISASFLATLMSFGCSILMFIIIGTVFMTIISMMGFKVFNIIVRDGIGGWFWA